MKKRIGIFCEAGCRYKYPHPLDLAELAARSGAGQAFVFGPEDEKVVQWNSGRGFAYKALVSAELVKKNPSLSNIVFTTKAIPELFKLDAVVVTTTVTLLIGLISRVLGKQTVYYAFELMVPGRPGSGRYSVFQLLLRYMNISVYTTGRPRSRMLKKALALKRTPKAVDCSALLETASSPTPGNVTLREWAESHIGARPRLLVALNAGLTESRCLDLVLETAAQLPKDIVFAMNGPISRIWLDRLNVVGARSGNCLYYGEVEGSRMDLINFLRGADIGLVLQKSRRADILNDRLYTPNKLFDFIAAGVPVICSRQITLRLARENGFGIVLKALTTECLRLELEALASDAQFLSTLMHNASNAFESRYHYEVSSAELLGEMLS